MPYTDIKEVMDHVHNLLSANKVALGLKTVAYGDASLIFEYPSAVIVADPTTTVIHGTRQFLNTFRLAIFVYHAKMTVDRDTRTKEDLALVQGIRNFMHAPVNRTLNNNIVFGYFDSIAPGTIARPGNELVIGSRMAWIGDERETFPS